jgi:hypothetical protein
MPGTFHAKLAEHSGQRDMTRWGTGLRDLQEEAGSGPSRHADQHGQSGIHIERTGL